MAFHAHNVDRIRGVHHVKPGGVVVGGVNAWWVDAAGTKTKIWPLARPSAPTLEAASSGATTLSLSFNLIQPGDGSQAFLVEWRAQGATAWNEFRPQVIGGIPYNWGTGYNLTVPQAGTYELRISRLTAAGWSLPSAVVTVTSAGSTAPPPTPGRPTLGALRSVRSTRYLDSDEPIWSASVSFLLPANAHQYVVTRTRNFGTARAVTRTLTYFEEVVGGREIVSEFIYHTGGEFDYRPLRIEIRAQEPGYNDGPIRRFTFR